MVRAGFAPAPIDQATMEKRMATSFSKGDKVEWDTSQGKTQGKVVRKQTSRTRIKGHEVAASKDDPQYISSRVTSRARGPLTSRPN